MEGEIVSTSPSTTEMNEEDNANESKSTEGNVDGNEAETVEDKIGNEADTVEDKIGNEAETVKEKIDEPKSIEDNVDGNEAETVKDKIDEPKSIEDNVGGNEAETVKDKFDEPKVNMMFDSLEDVRDYYKRYAKQMGFAVCTKSSTRDDDGRVKYVTIACNLHGRPNRTSKNTGCEAKIRIILSSSGKWRINAIVTDHNHVLSPTKSPFYQCNRVLEPCIKRKLEVIDRAMDKSNDSLVVEVEGHEKLTCLHEDCRNHIERVGRLRLGDGDASAVQKYFMKMQATNPSFFYIMDLDEKGQLKNVFWADARSRAAFEEFGDVIMFDTTYLTNRYDMPLAPFVGINHHGQSILLGCGLISSEDTNAFTWLLQSWLTCMSGCAPAAIVTDEDRAMQDAIQVVFPNARHRWCLWHIMKKLPEKLEGCKEYEGIKFALQNAVYDSWTPNEFENSWNLMVEKFNLHSNDWLIRLYNERHRWVPAFVKDSFWAGMSTTGRSESMKAFFDKYVTSKTTLKQFVEQYENALRDKAEKENLQDFYSFSSQVPCITHYDMEKQLQMVYTNVKFREFQHELTGKINCIGPFLVKEIGAISEYEVHEHVKVGEKLQRVNFNVFFNKVESKDDCEVKCSCRLFEFMGILCKHAISVLIEKEIYSIPAKYILRRWRKDIRRRHTTVKISYDDWSAKPAGRRFDMMCNAFHDVAYLATNSEDECRVVMDWIHELDERLKLLKIEGTCGNSQSVNRSNSDRSPGAEARRISKENQEVLTPLAIRSKGRPPSKRKLSKVEKKDSHITKYGRISNLEDQPLKDVVDVIPAQESTILTDSQSAQNVHVYRSDGDHPSMLQFDDVSLRMGMSHWPIEKPGFHYGPPSLAPHQQYFGHGSQGCFPADPNYASGNLVFNRCNTLRDPYSESGDK